MRLPAATPGPTRLRPTGVLSGRDPSADLGGDLETRQRSRSNPSRCADWVAPRKMEAAPHLKAGGGSPRPEPLQSNQRLGRWARPSHPPPQTLAAGDARTPRPGNVGRCPSPVGAVVLAATVSSRRTLARRIANVTAAHGPASSRANGPVSFGGKPSPETWITGRDRSMSNGFRRGARRIPNTGNAAARRSVRYKRRYRDNLLHQNLLHHPSRRLRYKI